MKTIKRFTASWCGPCKALAMVIDSIDTDVPIEVVDIDENRDAAIGAGVRGVPTLIMYEDDKEIKRYTGVMVESHLTEWIKND